MDPINSPFGRIGKGLVSNPMSLRVQRRPLSTPLTGSIDIDRIILSEIDDVALGEIMTINPRNLLPLVEGEVYRYDSVFWYRRVAGFVKSALVPYRTGANWRGLWRGLCSLTMANQTHDYTALSFAVLSSLQEGSRDSLPLEGNNSWYSRVSGPDNVLDPAILEVLLHWTRHSGQPLKNLVAACAIVGVTDALRTILSRVVEEWELEESSPPARDQFYADFKKEEKSCDRNC